MSPTSTTPDHPLGVPPVTSPTTAGPIDPIAEEAIDDSDHSEDGGVELAPLPTILRGRGPPRTSFSSGVGIGVNGDPSTGPRKRTSFSSGAGVGVGENGVGPRKRTSFSSGAGVGIGETAGNRRRAASTGMYGPGGPLRPRGYSTGARSMSGKSMNEGGVDPNNPPAFTALGPTVSRMSQRSNQTFMDPLGLVGMSDLTRVETRTERRARARAGTVTTMASLARHTSVLSGISKKIDEESDDDETVERLVAVTINDAGEEIVYPDGGKDAWLCLLGGVCAAVCAFGLGASVGAFQSYYSEHLLSDYSSSQIAWIGSTQAAICFGMCLFTGPLFDRYGCRPLLAAGTFTLVLAFCLLSLCTEYYQIFLCHATLMAIGMDLMFIVPMGAVGQWFLLKRGLAFGILMMGSSAGAIIWPAVVANLPQKIGFGWTMRLMALLIGCLGIASTLLVRTRLPPRPPGPFFHFEEFKNPAYACVAFSFPFFAFGFFSFLTFIGTYGKIVGVGELGPYLLMICNGSSGFGRVLAGVGADYLGTFNVAFFGEVVMVILMFAWLGMKTPGALIALCVIYGMFSGAPVSLQGPMVTASATDPRMAGTLIGQALMVQSFAQLCGPPIFGAIVGTGSNEEMLQRFPHAIAFGASMLAISAMLILGARLYRTRELFAIV